MRIFAGVRLGGGVKRHWGLSTTAIFAKNFRDTASSINATPCRPVIDCKMNDLEWLFHVKIRFWPALLDSDSECLSFKK